MNHAELIKRFYGCFKNSDAEGMVNCYADDINFRDPVFGELRGKEAKNMWRMLIERSEGELKIDFFDDTAVGNNGSANWLAHYTFSPTGRKVVNRIPATFEFKEGKITKYIDSFNLYTWTKQAFGWKGYLLGWTTKMQLTIRKRSLKLLKKYTGTNH